MVIVDPVVDSTKDAWNEKIIERYRGRIVTIETAEWQSSFNNRGGEGGTKLGYRFVDEMKRFTCVSSLAGKKGLTFSKKKKSERRDWAICSFFFFSFSLNQPSCTIRNVRWQLYVISNPNEFSILILDVKISRVTKEKTKRTMRIERRNPYKLCKLVVQHFKFTIFIHPLFSYSSSHARDNKSINYL